MFPYKFNNKAFDSLGWFFLIIWIVFTLFPLYWVGSSSFKKPSEVFGIPPTWKFTPTVDNYKILLGLDPIPTRILDTNTVIKSKAQSPFLKNLLSSIIVSTISTIMAILIGTPAGYTLARYQFKYREFLTSLIFFARLLPAVAILIPTYTIMMEFGLLGTYLGLILVYLSFNTPLVVWMMKGYFSQLPLNLEEAARIDGCSRWGAFINVILPISLPGISSAAIMTFILSWNEFMFAIMLTSRDTRTLTGLISTYITDSGILWGRLFAASTLILFPIIIFTLLVQGKLFTGLQGAAKG